MANLNIECPQDLLEAIDQFAVKHAKETRMKVSRVTAARVLIRLALETVEGSKSPPSC
jgi:hypothetical protein